MKKKWFLLLGLVMMVVTLTLWRTSLDEPVADTTEDTAVVEDSTGSDDVSETDPYKDNLDAALEELEQIDL